MSDDLVKIKQVKRKGEVCWLFSILVAKKTLTCDTTYKSERSAQRAAANFYTRYIKV